MLITSQEKIKLDVSIGFHSALQMTNTQFRILVIGGSTSMLPIPYDILTQYEAVLKKQQFLFLATPITESGSGIILIFEANIRFLIPNQNMCICLSKNCKKRIRRPNSKSRQRMPCPSSCESSFQRLYARRRSDERSSALMLQQ